MRSLSSFSAIILFALVALPGDGAAQSPKSGTAPVRPPVVTPVPQGDGARRITVLAAREAVDKGQAIVVDVRSEESYNAGHVKGARWINLNEIEARIKELPRDKMIITYCS
ncbi:MAG TPA: rhodanese-like domain-containing protein [Pyrinomonadaceae bacterium]|nr:rhodanese-like domain-containing protein [Pyrinomonadaceae bacterium]